VTTSPPVKETLRSPIWMMAVPSGTLSNESSVPKTSVVDRAPNVTVQASFVQDTVLIPWVTLLPLTKENVRKLMSEHRGDVRQLGVAEEAPDDLR
jgi:hypothetical protein